MKNLEWLGVDYMIPIGGDDTLSYGVHLFKNGLKVMAIPKTMDNDVPGTDYCIGFSTCVTRTIELTHKLRTSAGSHERFLVIEVFGRYAGYTALLPTMAGASNRCVIPEHPFQLRAVDVDLDHVRRSYLRNALASLPEHAQLSDVDIEFLAAETRRGRAFVEETIDELQAEAG